MASKVAYISGRSAKSPAATPKVSPWHSPVPYLFGGLAAMLGLIAFALLILACSYWKLSGYDDQNDESGTERDLETGDYGKGDQTQKPKPIWEEKFLVIMAGQAKPTFLATPIMNRSSSFEDYSNDYTTSCTCVCQNSENKSLEMSEAAETEQRQQEQRENIETCDLATTSSDDQNQTH